MKISDKVQRVLAVERISPKELQYMLDRLAIVTLRTCNFRYFHWAFRIEGNVLQDMQYADVVNVGRSTSTNRMLEEHDDCDGEGCRGCGWIGQVSRVVRDTTAHALIP